MKYHKQLLKHDPENKVFGDCYRTAIACLLDLHPSEVPHFGENYEDDDDKFNDKIDAFLASRSLTRTQVRYECSLEDVLTSQRVLNPGVFFLLGGVSSLGCGHIVVGLDDKICWDPSPNDTGEALAPYPGHGYIIQHLLPLFMKAESAPAS